jgi:hypothetical protein
MLTRQVQLSVENAEFRRNLQLICPKGVIFRRDRSGTRNKALISANLSARNMFSSSRSVLLYSLGQHIVMLSAEASNLRENGTGTKEGEKLHGTSLYFSNATLH